MSTARVFWPCIPANRKKFSPSLQNKTCRKFADVFSRPGWIAVYSNNGLTEIEIHEGVAEENGNFTLWLGTIDDERMPVQDIKWEIIKPIDNETIAFVSIISNS